jgi:hypothetical protein
MKKELAILLASVFIISSLVVLAQKPDPGFVYGPNNNVNLRSRVFHDWLEPDYVWTTAKWSKDFEWEGFMDPDPDKDDDTDVGAWLLVNLEAYLDEEEDPLPWPDGEVPEEALWKVIVTFKVMRVGNDLTTWLLYEDEGAIMVFDDYYDNDLPGPYTFGQDVPCYIMFQAHLKIYEWDDGLGDWVLYDDYNFIGMPPYGLGQPLFVTVET